MVLKRVSPEEYRQAGVLYDIHIAAAKFFQEALARSREAREYLRERGISQETVAEFGIGFAPPERDALLLHLINLGFRPDDILRAGLAVKTERGLQIDRFRGRIIFPIHDHFGKVVGFTGRILPRLASDRTGKYLNSPETPIFNKSRVLYGLFKAKPFIREQGEVILVEGQTDFLLSWQSGVRNVAAASGTALTADHLRILRRLSERVVLCFDNDAAGLAAGERAIELALREDFHVRVVVFGDEEGAKDPAEVALRDAAALKKLFASARPVLDFYLQRYLGAVPQGDTPDAFLALKKGVRAILAKLHAVQSSVERNLWIKELSARTGIAEHALMEEFEQITPSLQQRSDVAEDTFPGSLPKASRAEKAAQLLLAAALRREDFSILEDVEPFFPARYQQALSLLRAGARRAEDDPKLDALLSFLILRAGMAEVEDAEIASLKQVLYSEHEKKLYREIARTVREAESKGDEQRLSALLEQLNRYIHERRHHNGAKN
ncbi:toprim domain-containing protein [Candidatus Parcubacteria bacterium]|nr:MAG: toprim domain-containing protein [Candidatus Parcubacteria bacterium]